MTNERGWPRLPEHAEPLNNWNSLVGVFQCYQQMLQWPADVGEGKKAVNLRAGKYLQAELDRIPHTDIQRHLAWAAVFSSTDEEPGVMLSAETKDQ